MRRPSFIGFGIAKALGVLIAAAAVPILAQTTYHDPQGRYDLDLPAGWLVTPDKASGQIVATNGVLQVVVSVKAQNNSNAMTAKKFVDVTASEFASQCPAFQNRGTGTVTLAGASGVSALFLCDNKKTPSVAETSAALTANGVLAGFTTIVPLGQFYSSLPVLDGIRSSLRVTGAPVAAAESTGDSKALNELKRACMAGAFTQEDCARRIGILMGQEAAAAPAPAAPAGPASPIAGGTVYRDGQGRFTLQVPPGWTATAEGDNGALGVQLRSGPTWINIMPAEAAASTSDVVVHQEQKIAARSGSDRKPPFGAGGLIQLFGNGVELTYDHFGGVSPQGDAVESYIGGVGPLTGGGKLHLLLIASLSQAQTSAGGALFLSLAQSVRFGAP
jgi:hypothetical protein